ncbi:MAG: hypothetical protein ABID63_12060 [Pseudomonadota bacterium]
MQLKRAIVVHFNGPTGRVEAKGYPYDLQNVSKLKAKGLSCSTIKASDVHVVNGRRNSYGEIGVIFDVHDASVIHAAKSSDAGTSEWLDENSTASEDDIRDSICKRSDCEANEWRVSESDILGIFMFNDPSNVRIFCDLGDLGYTSSYKSVGVEEVAKDFQQFPIFSTNGTSFTKFCRKTKQWIPVAYKKIMR